MGIRKDKVTVQEALDRCLDELYTGGASIEQCLARYPEYASELRPLLRTAERLDAVNEVRPSKAWKSRLRKQLAGEQERPRPRWFRWPSMVVVALFVLLIATLALWMGINLEVSGGSLTPLPPMTNFFSSQQGVKPASFALQSPPRARPQGNKVQALEAGARIGPDRAGADMEMSLARAHRGNTSGNRSVPSEGELEKNNGKSERVHN